MGKIVYNGFEIEDLIGQKYNRWNFVYLRLGRSNQ
jgi:hypothetical protein